MSDDFEVETADAGASKHYPVQASSLKKGQHILIKGRPCKIDNISTSKPGKHGSAKCSFVAIDIFTGKKSEAISPGHANVDVPIVTRKEYLASGIDNAGFLNLYDEESGDMIEDIRLPEGDMGDKIKGMVDADAMCMVSVIRSMGEEKIIDVKEDNNKNY